MTWAFNAAGFPNAEGLGVNAFGVRADVYSDAASSVNVDSGVIAAGGVSGAEGRAAHALTNLSPAHVNSVNADVGVIVVDVDASRLFTGLSNVGPEPSMW